MVANKKTTAANTTKGKTAKAKGGAKAAKAIKTTKVAKTTNGDDGNAFKGIKAGTKAAMLLGLVTAKTGATKPAMLKALGGWKGCGNYLRIACDKAGLKLERKKVDGETRWFAR